MTLLELLHRPPGETTAVVLPERGIRITYDSLRRQVAAAADIFASAGIGNAARVAMALPNGLETIVCFLGASVAGTSAPLNPAYRHDEFVFFLEDTDAKLLVLPPAGADEARRAAAERGVPILDADVDPEGTVRFFPTSTGRTAGPPQPDDVALILHTSGTTGRPKRVPLRHRNLAVSAENIAQTYQLTANDVAMTVMPLFHVHGLLASTLATLLTGGTMVVPEKFNPLSFWRTVRECRATWYSAVPTMHRLLLARAGDQRPIGAEHLRFIRSASAPLSFHTMEKLEHVFGAPVLEAYGMTEASHQIASNPLPPGVRRAQSVGLGTGVKISIMDTHGHHSHLGMGHAGEVVIQGPSIIDGYESNPEANATSFVDGWFRTGDQGIIDPDGYLRLLARLKELINRGGEKIAPMEIGQVLLKHPAVAEAVCFGVPHPTWGEEVTAAVVLRAPVPVPELLSFCRDHLADFKCPKKIHVVDAIPRTATGKIQRRALVEAFTEK
ncbi:MAG: AMP-dependent synthetase [Acidobacteria bacterium]|nr:MAG: AMP-dependent synthetase [Acidobacteriota bacterium]